MLMITARLLPPSAIADMVIFNITIGLLVSIAQLGITPNIINSKNLSDELIKKYNFILVFTFSIVSVVFYIFSNGISEYINNSVIVNYREVIIAVFFFRLMYLLPEAYMMKALNFKLLFICELFSNTLGFFCFLYFLLF
ncbi:oligosaccharide flippase family protein [Photobacterium kishitanii]|uniref:oligosaccharide flippase family protein n=1 Tax=Photobacterium kishitanii TaxID=318456 RepID=UPI0005D45D9E|nr:hypothetical protein UA41_14455 [Photobacterium kishitanii]